MSERKPLGQLSERQLYRRAAQIRELIGKHDFNRGDALIAAGIVGAGLATALALRIAKKRGNRITDQDGQEVTITHGPAHYMRHTVSYVLGDGTAGSFPEDIAEAKRLQNPTVADEDITVFAMGPGGATTHEVRDGLTEGPLFRDRVRYGASLVIQALQNRRASNRPED